VISDLKIVLSSKMVLFILSLSASLRVLFFFIFLPNTPSPFGPDEGTYGALVKFVSEGISALSRPFIQLC
jgi:hypothetical protein